MGGAVIHNGTWRVNGNLAVSRAIGESDPSNFSRAIWRELTNITGSVNYRYDVYFEARVFRTSDRRDHRT